MRRVMIIEWTTKSGFRWEKDKKKSLGPVTTIQIGHIAIMFVPNISLSRAITEYQGIWHD